MHEKPTTLVKVWIALLALLALSAASAWLRLGAWNSVANLGIAVLKALLVALFFMRLATGGALLLRVVALTALFTLALLLALSGSDYATRELFRAPWDQPTAAQVQSAAASATGRTRSGRDDQNEP
ncbi:Caa(3)-type oxidase subunit IV [Massilia agilis]|uniref:Caa(3)-type oxidase subunit IV n=1 Tax=Massilia agilis TaxID=1811226 RepID=A0ABT2DC16_9BURK|nr:cytochrome C oxidase subunit IV family protein [Massilia agilis]MCS0808865.1 Caa(3)-type oxidase subunit IV [Massilia agilis]